MTNGESLTGAHNSMGDVRAQSDILLHHFLVPYLNHTNSFCVVDNMFCKSKLRKLKHEVDLILLIHSLSTKQTTENNVT